MLEIEQRYRKEIIGSRAVVYSKDVENIMDRERI